MLKTVKNVFITVGSAMVSFWFLCLWAIIFVVTGVLLLVDWVHKVWTNRRIPWIEAVTNWWAKAFSCPFGKL